MNTLRQLSLTLLATLLLGLPTSAQLVSAKVFPAGLGPKAPFGGSLLMDPVDVAVMGWCHTPVSWAYVADDVSHKIIRWVMTPTGSAVLPSEWTMFTDGPFGIAVNDIPGHEEQEFVYATGTSLGGNSSVQVFDKWGNLQQTFRGNPLEPFFWPTGIAVGPEGNVFVVDESYGRVFEFVGADVRAGEWAFPVNEYETDYRPFDVSVDHMRRVHLAVRAIAPSDDDKIQTYEYGSSTPEFPMAADELAGIDARDLFQTRYSLTLDPDVTTLTWNDVTAPSYSADFYSSQSVPVSAPSVPMLGGLELQRTWRVIGSIDGEKKVQCERRTYVTDRADGEVQTLSSKKNSTPRPDDAVGWWKLDEDGTASTPISKDIMTGVHGSWEGPNLTASEGVVRCALKFDGGLSGVDVPPNAALEVGLNDFSLEAWIRVTAPSASTETFLDKRSLVGVGYRLFLDAGQPGLEMYDGSTAHMTTSTTNIQDGLWHHVAMVVTRGVDTKIYVDGSLVATNDNSGVIGSLSSGMGLSIGRGNPLDTSGLEGGLDEVTLYHRAITATQVSAIKKAECAGKHLPFALIGSTPYVPGALHLPVSSISHSF